MKFHTQEYRDATHAQLSCIVAAVLAYSRQLTESADNIYLAVMDACEDQIELLGAAISDELKLQGMHMSTEDVVDQILEPELGPLVRSKIVQQKNDYLNRARASRSQ